MQSTWGHTSPFGCQAQSTPRWYQEIWSGRALTSLTRLAKIFKAVFKIFRIWAFLILTKLARNFSDWLNWQKLCNLSDFVHGRLLVKCLWREFSMFIFSFLLNFSLKTLPKAQRTRGLSSAYQSNFLIKHLQNLDQAPTSKFQPNISKT